MEGLALRGYLVRERDVVYRSGWWSRTVTAVPFSRIQHSEISKDLWPLARALHPQTLHSWCIGRQFGDSWTEHGTARNIRRMLESHTDA